jgi:hypothetical protein
VNETHAQRVNYRAQCENKFNASDIPQCFPPQFTVFTLIAVALRMSSEKKERKTPKELVATPPHRAGCSRRLRRSAEPVGKDVVVVMIALWTTVMMTKTIGTAGGGDATARGTLLLYSM